MPKHRETKNLPYSLEQMFALVDDVEKYPSFLPWCVAARLLERHEGGFTADMTIGFKMFREVFRSKVTTERPAHVHVEYIRGPLKYLHNDWRFEDDGQGGTNIHFNVEFEFKSRMLERLIGTLFGEAVHRMVGAFEARAHALYGPSKGTSARRRAPSSTGKPASA